MSSKQNTLAVGVSLINAAPAIINLMKLFRQDHTGEQTKAAAIEAGKAILVSGGQIALANNPKFNENYGAVIQAAYDASEKPENAFDPSKVEIPGTPAARSVEVVPQLPPSSSPKKAPAKRKR